MADIARIFSNCKLYNQPDTVYYKCSVDLEEYVQPLLQNLRDKRDDSPPRERKGGKEKMPGAKKRI
jgi:hypothetical protein